jgi:hypothetical protein
MWTPAELSCAQAAPAAVHRCLDFAPGRSGHALPPPSSSLHLPASPAQLPANWLMMLPKQSSLPMCLLWCVRLFSRSAKKPLNDGHASIVPPSAAGRLMGQSQAGTLPPQGRLAAAPVAQASACGKRAAHQHCQAPLRNDILCSVQVPG